MKRAIVGAVLLWALAWPLVHRAVVARFDVNPWKLGGFAMYAVPTPPVVTALMTDRGGELAALPESELPRASREALDRFRAERHALGSLRRPDDLAEAVFADAPQMRWLLVVVQKSRLDAETALVSTSQERFVYDRDQPGP